MSKPDDERHGGGWRAGGWQARWPTLLLGLFLLALLAFVIWGLSAVWSRSGEVKISVHGWIALTIAFVVTGLLGGGLMALAFHSARHGYDDNVGLGDEEDPS